MTIDCSYSDLSKMIDHSLLNPTLDQAALEEGIRVAIAYDVASVCIMPFALARCAELLAPTTVKPSTTIGFPHGGHTTAAKVREAEIALAEGALELDMVINISQALSGNWRYVEEEIEAVTLAAHTAHRAVKVIFENCHLTDNQKIRLCDICSSIGVDWVKTSTGYGGGGATIEDLKLMRAHCPDHVQVKAAGGVRDLDRLLEVRSLGVSRVGASATKAILDEARVRLELPAIVSPAGPAAGY
jgi:deoxyribose-phosphate aldolase